MRSFLKFSQKRVFWGALIAVGAAAIAVLNWQFLHTEKVAAISLPLSASVTQVRLPQDPPRVAEEDFYRSSNYDQLLNLLHAKLNHSLDDARAALRGIATTRPTLAIDLAEALGRTEEEKTGWVIDVMEQWAKRDPNASLAWVMQNGTRVSELARGALPGVVLDAMAAGDPQMLLGFVDGLLHTGVDKNPSSGIPPAVAVHLGLEALIKSGQLDLAQAAVETWAHDPLYPTIGASAYEIVAMAIGKTAPQEAGIWLKSLPASEDRNAALGTLATTWANTDPAAAMQWSQTLAPEDGRADVVRDTFSEWIQSDDDAATKWLAGYITHSPPPPDDDHLIGALLSYSPTVKSKPDLAAQWLDLISDPKAREAYQEQVILSWGGSDRVAAVDYVWKSPTMSQEQKSSLVQRLQTYENDD